ncbi:MAG: serine/threonine protein kinase, partial [Planctomycetota bacterium]|nr:serine/threonine protein kinase [Planctomycetota bacterium]
RMVWEERLSQGQEASFGEIMVELGYLTPEQLTSLRAEERRRRCLIRGYEILHKVGAGAVGTVYRARQIAMERDVAIKILHPRLAKRQEIVAKFVEEARAVARLNHPHIVQGIDVGESAGYYYFAMEFLGGGTLADRLAQEGPLSEQEALVYLYQVAAALAHAWERRIIHCDIKPANLMLDEAGRLKVTDLGLAQVGEAMAQRPDGGRRVARGTPYYISPEQIETPHDLDCRCDLYALGATFYHLLSGRPPFSGRDKKSIVLARLRQEPAPLASLRPELSPGCTALIHRLLARRREDRPATPSEVMSQISALGIDAGKAGLLIGLICKPPPHPKPLPRSTRQMLPASVRARRRPRALPWRSPARLSRLWLYLGAIFTGLLVVLALYSLFRGWW